MRDPWAQLLTETDSEFRAFDRWLRAVPRIAPNEITLAERHSWAERAQAFDLLHDAPEDLTSKLTEVVMNMTDGALIASRRWLLEQIGSTEPVDPKTITRILDTIARLQEVAENSRAGKQQDFSALSDEDLYVIDESRRLLAGR